MRTHTRFIVLVALAFTAIGGVACEGYDGGTTGEQTPAEDTGGDGGLY